MPHDPAASISRIAHFYPANVMDTTPNSSSSDSPYLRGRRSIAALFTTSDTAQSAVHALTESGFVSDEIQQNEQDGGYLVTVFNPVHLAEAAAIFQQHGGSLPDGDSASYENGKEAGAEADDAGAPAIPVDSGLSEPGSRHRVGGGVFTRSSGSGGSGGGTATGGSLFGSSR